MVYLLIASLELYAVSTWAWHQPRMTLAFLAAFLAAVCGLHDGYNLKAKSPANATRRDHLADLESVTPDKRSRAIIGRRAEV